MLLIYLYITIFDNFLLKRGNIETFKRYYITCELFANHSYRSYKKYSRNFLLYFESLNR